MAVMLRSLGIPARVGVGFTQGALQPDGSWVITSHDAHAWVEVDFDTNGWVRFDPTPLVNGQGGQQGFTSPAPQTSAAATSTSTSVAPTAITAGGNKADQDTTQSSSAPLTADAPASGTTAVGRWLWLVLALLVLGVLLFGPAAFRLLGRRRRLRQIRAGDPHAATLAWVEIEDLAVDHGVGVGAAESSRVAANRFGPARSFGRRGSGPAARSHCRRRARVVRAGVRRICCRARGRARHDGHPHRASAGADRRPGGRDRGRAHRVGGTCTDDHR